ncbi:nuclear transport factor 2 family protein [Thermopolyspora sp. NPDC052614]|uniref:nuclear transport factor 2 family protein n=1 Tax=Thermopolyspora sp. NPDC052614 TaxID=3155682 RepID=UPI003414667B
MEAAPVAEPYVPTDEDRASVEAWFREYDALAAKADIERLADMAVFPLNVVSDDSAGEGVAAQWTRERYVETMAQVMGGGGDVRMESVRTPHFLSAGLVVVITEATMTWEGGSTRTRYADLLIKNDGKWRFQTMVQSGWGDNLRS